MSDPRDRRQSERYPVTGDTTCGLTGRVITDLGAVRIKNVSMEGIGFLANKPPDAGSLVALEIVNKTKSFHRVSLVKVAHVTPQVGGVFLVGGTFETPLTYQELTALVM